MDKKYQKKNKIDRKYRQKKTKKIVTKYKIKYKKIYNIQKRDATNCKLIHKYAKIYKKYIKNISNYSNLSTTMQLNNKSAIKCNEKMTKSRKTCTNIALIDN